jgi:DNA-binding transcriptional LysR family regulator
MRPRLDQLEALLWISKLGSFRSAARKLRLSQPAISSRIRELENELGISLLDRSHHRPLITAEGLEVLRHAEQMIGLAESFRTRFGERDRLPKSIRMGAADSFALLHLSSLLESLAELHPATQVNVEVGFSTNLDRKLQAGELDIAFLTAPTASSSVIVEPLITLELAWLASPKLGIHGQRLVPAGLFQRPIITNPGPSHLYNTIHDWFAVAGLVPQRLNTCTNLTIVAKLTADGIGISVLPPALVRRELARGHLVRLMTAPDLPVHYISVGYRVWTEQGDLAPIANLAHTLVARRGRATA